SRGGRGRDPGARGLGGGVQPRAHGLDPGRVPGRAARLRALLARAGVLPRGAPAGVPAGLEAPPRGHADPGAAHRLRRRGPRARAQALRRGTGTIMLVWRWYVSYWAPNARTR